MIHEKRRQTIEWRIFRKIDIQRIGSFVFEEYRKAIEIKTHCSINFNILCEGGISFESDSLDILDDGGPLDIKKVKTIQIAFRNYKNGNHIDFDLREGRYSEGEIIVIGDNRDWVNGTFVSILEIIDSVEPQRNFFLAHKKIILHVVAICIGYSICTILEYLFLRIFKIPVMQINNSYQTLHSIGLFLNENKWAYYLILIFFAWVEGIITFASPLINWLSDLWPSIEFDFGPNYKKIIRNRRERIGFVASIVIIPLLINLLTAII